MKKLNKKLKVIFIGNRSLILKEILSHKYLQLVAFDIEDPAKYLDDTKKISHFKGKKQLIDFVKKNDFDILISAGCPYIIPLDRLPKKKIYINSHPSALPYGRGPHPLNECFLSNHQKSGVTLHFISNEIDAGDIINQLMFDLTEDVDLELLQSIIFEIEKENFIKGINILIENNLKFVGKKQLGLHTYYKRNLSNQQESIDKICCKDALARIRAYSSENLGFKLKLCKDKEITIYTAKKIINKFILNRYVKNNIGLVLLSQNFLLLKLKDGIIRVDRWKI